MQKLSLKQITLTGDPRTMGQQHGELLKEQIATFMAMRFDAVRKYCRDRGRPNIDGLLELGKQSMWRHAQWDPAGHAEHLGICEGADLDPVELHTVTNMTDIRDPLLLAAESGPPLVPRPDEGCSSILIPPSGTASGTPLVGQTWDLNPPDVEFIVAFYRTPTDGPKSWTVTCNGCLSLVGINEHGVSVGTTNIKTYGARPGVGYLSILHRALRSRTAAEASDTVKNAPHAGAHTYWLADATEQIEWEASPNGQFKRDTSAGPIWRTNHCLSEAHVKIQGEAPSESSHARFDLIGERLADGGYDLDKMRDLFADRSKGELGINRYPEDEKGTATNSVFIASPAERRAWACRGPADRGEWVELGFD